MVGWTCEAVTAQQPSSSHAHGPRELVESENAAEVYSRCFHASQLRSPRRCCEERRLVDTQDLEHRVFASDESVWKEPEGFAGEAASDDQEGERNLSKAAGSTQANSRFSRSSKRSPRSERNFDSFIVDHDALATTLERNSLIFYHNLYVVEERNRLEISSNSFLCHHVCVE